MWVVNTDEGICSNVVLVREGGQSDGRDGNCRYGCADGSAGHKTKRRALVCLRRWFLERAKAFREAAESVREELALGKVGGK